MFEKLTNLKLSKAHYFLIFLLILGLSTYLKLFGLGKYFFWGDDALHIYFAHIFNGNILTHSSIDTHPPLYYFFLKIYLELFGIESRIGVRSVSLIAGTMALIVYFFSTYSLTQKKWPTLVGTYLIGTSVVMTLQSQVLRGYSLMILFLLLMIHLVLGSRFGKRELYFGVIFTLAACLTHYSAVIVAAFTGLIGLFRIYKSSEIASKRLSLTIWIGGHLLSTFLVYYLGSKYTNPIVGSYIEASTSHGILESLFLLASIIEYSFLRKEYVIPFLLAGAFIFSIFLLIKDRKWDWAILAFGPFALAVVLSELKLYPLSTDRWCLYLLPSTLLGITYLLSKLQTPKLKAVGALWLGLIVFNQVTAPKSVFRPNSIRANFHWTPSAKELSEFNDYFKSPGIEKRKVLYGNSIRHMLRVERTYKPSWALFNDLERSRLRGCYEYHTLRKTEGAAPGICKCLKRLKKKQKIEKVYVMSYALSKKGLEKSQGLCYTIDSVREKKSSSLIGLTIIPEYFNRHLSE